MITQVAGQLSVATVSWTRRLAGSGEAKELHKS